MRRRACHLALVLLAAGLGVAPAFADTAPPRIRILSPSPGASFNHDLRLAAVVTDADGLGRVTFLADGKPIRSFTTGLRSGVPVSFLWRRAGELSPGTHVISVLALDKQRSNPVTRRSNSATKQVEVTRIDVAKLPLARTAVTIAVTGTGVDRAVHGTVRATGAAFPRSLFPLDGKVRVVWQVWSNGRFKTRHRDVTEELSPYLLRQRLARKGRWRVTVRFDARPPYRSSTSRTVTFAAQ